MATLGRWTGGAVSGSPTTSWTAPSNIFPTQQRNDGSTYSSFVAKQKYISYKIFK
jgi:hypothetical protein